MKIKGFLNREPVLCIAALLAVLSMCVVPPSAGYADYIDLRVLCLLFDLMLVVAGLQDCGLFVALARRLLAGEKNLRLICLLLVWLPFFSSMLITNDVALITFVPFTILILEMSGQKRQMIWMIVLQTAAANLGSMATPVGNPQNLFLYGTFQIPAGQFFAVLLPLTILSLAALSAAALFSGHETIRIGFPEGQKLRNKKQLAVCMVLFLLCLLSVFHVLHYGVLTVIAVIGICICSPRLLARADYGLLVTFICFFVFAGNMGNVEALHQVISGVMEKHALAAAVASSQIISNVPAAVLLSGFTEDWKSLLVGTNIGGLGTPIASLASLISLKFYMKTEEARPWEYLKVFTAVNVAGLAVLTGYYMLFW